MPKRLTGKYRWRYQAMDEDDAFLLLGKLPTYFHMSVPYPIGWNVQTKDGKNVGTSISLKCAMYDEDGNELQEPEYQPNEYEVVRNDE